MLTVIGVPVYLHYCGGELEKINYVMKGESCCGGEEDDAESTDEGCCKDEGLIIKNNIDFTLAQFNNFDLVRTFSELFYTALPVIVYNIHLTAPVVISKAFHPPKLQNDLMIAVSVLRI